MSIPSHDHTAFLRALRNLLAAEMPAQERLDRITHWVTQELKADVCSIYLQAQDKSFELCATEGLARRAVHKTRLKAGEGIVGHIAATLEPYQTKEAVRDPHFAPRPETDEYKLTSFFGVPLVRAGNLLGVITIQNRDSRFYSQNEEETLQTIAMVLSEFIAAENFTNRITKPANAISKTQVFSGASAVNLVAIGKALVRRPSFAVSHFVASSASFEQGRLVECFDKLVASIERLIERARSLSEFETTSVLEAHKVMACDPEWRGNIVAYLDKGLTAEAAVEQELDNLRRRFRRITNVQIRQRLHDIEDISLRLIRILRGEEWGLLSSTIPENPILVARTLGPAELLDYADIGLCGLVVEEGASSSHTAIVARALGLTMISGILGFTDKVDMGQPLVLDGESGRVFLNPEPATLTAFEEKIKAHKQRAERHSSHRDLPCETLDGVAIDLHITAGLRAELDALDNTGAKGIGLFRTELDFLIASHLPKRQAQEKLYRSVLEGAKGRPVIFRTLDIGGDKVLPYLKIADEDNPALGLRAIRLTLARPTLLRAQIQALLRASYGRNLELMFPMISSKEEFVAAKLICEEERQKLKARGARIASKVIYGAMIEVPSLLYDLDHLLPEVDFVSVGSNDFHQYFWAADRGNHNVSELFDELNVQFLSALKTIERACAHYQVPLGLCGQMASDPCSALALVGLGFRHLSVAPGQFGFIKETLRNVKYVEIKSIIDKALTGKGSASTLRKNLDQWVPSE